MQTGFESRTNSVDALAKLGGHERPGALHERIGVPRTLSFDHILIPLDDDPKGMREKRVTSPYQETAWRAFRRYIKPYKLSSRPRSRLLLAVLFACLLLTFAINYLLSSEVPKANLPLEMNNFPVPQLPDFSNTVFVGHQKNDVDSICSAIAAAELFRGVAARADDINRETEFVLKYFGLPVPPLASDPSFANHDWCLLDHNQKDKVPAGVDLDKIVCVIDHHQLLGNAIEISEPRMIDIQPWGSTTTMIAFKFFASKREIPRPIAGCLLGGVLSDTVNLRSPTTTDYDRVSPYLHVRGVVIAPPHLFFLLFSSRWQ